jgi:hypothetical protein
MNKSVGKHALWSLTYIYLNKYDNVTVRFRNQYAVLISDCKHSCVYVYAIDLAAK